MGTHYLLSRPGMPYPRLCDGRFSEKPKLSFRIPEKRMFSVCNLQRDAFFPAQENVLNNLLLYQYVNTVQLSVILAITKSVKPWDKEYKTQYADLNGYVEFQIVISSVYCVFSSKCSLLGENESRDVEKWHRPEGTQWQILLRQPKSAN